jgi:HEAT repeat protein
VEALPIHFLGNKKTSAGFSVIASESAARLGNVSRKSMAPFRDCLDASRSRAIRRIPHTARFRHPLLAFSLVAIAAIAGARQGPSQSTPGTAAAASPAAGSQHSGVPGLAYKLVAGKTAVYQLHYESNAHADFRVLFQNQKPQAPAQSSSLVYTVSAELNGQWVETIVDADTSRFRTLYVLRNGKARLMVNDRDQAAQAETIVANLARGIVVERSPDGKALAVYMNPATDKVSSDFALSLFGETEFLLPAGGGTSTWQSHEEDPTGAYSARYQILGSASPADRSGQNPARTVAIRKTRLQYLLEPSESSLPGQTPMRKQAIPSGSLEAHFDPESGDLTSLSGTGTQDTIIEEKKVAHSVTTVGLSRIAEKAAAQEELTELRHVAGFLEDAGSRLSLYTKPSPQEMQQSIQRTQLGEETLESLLQQLDAVEASKTSSDQTELYLKFKALVYLHPESCGRLGGLLANASAQGPTFAILTRALGSIGNAQAQAALVAAINARPGDLVAVSNLIPTLAETPDPSVAAEAVIRQLSTGPADDSISATALLALGSMAHGLAKKSPARSSKIVHDLLRQTTVNQPEGHTHDLIEALGNTQSAVAIAALTAFTKNPAPQLRAAALDALRFMRSPGVDGLLLKGLGDADGTPRLEAAYALSYRKMTAESFAAQKKALLADDNEKTRAVLLSNIWKSQQQFPEARVLVKSSADHDPSEYVSKLAKGMLLEGQ